MKTVSVAEMVELERRSMARGVSGEELMGRAGREAARLAETLFQRYRHLRSVAVVTGAGNNAGDGFVVAAALKLPVTVYAAVPRSKLRGDAALYASRLPADVPVVESATPPVFRPDQLIVDALLGTGCRGSLREPFADYIAAINASGAPVLSLDLPSGLDGDSGAIDPAAVRADWTVTFGFPKTGLFRREGPRHTGILKVVEIGLVPGLDADLPGRFDAFTLFDARKLLGRLVFGGYKNTRGRLLVFAGSREYPGAARLCTLAAQRAGAGFVRLVSSAPADAGFAASLVRCEFTSELFGLVDAVAAGPGWGTTPEHAMMLHRILAAGKPAVLDADALNLLARNPELWRPSPRSVVTPHLGEFQRLAAAWGIEAGDDVVVNALNLARAMNCVVVLKDPRTVVASPEGDYSINSSGSPALGTAGSGDVLTGVIGSFLAAGLGAADAAKLGVYLHGLAGETIPQRGLIADDLPGRLADAMLEVSPVS